MNKFIPVITFLLASVLSSETAENKIEWEQTEGAERYTVQIRKEDKSLLLDEKTSNLYFKISLEQTGLYEYRVGAENKIGNVVWSDWQSLTVQKKETAESKIPRKKILLEWEESPQVIKYSLEIEDESGKNIYKKDLESSKAYVDLPEGKYRYRVSSMNQLKNSSASEWENFEVKKKEQSKSADTLRWEVIRRSAVLPGWGQYHRKDSFYRVFSYPLSVSLLASLYYLNYKNNTEAQKRYDKDISILALSQNSISAKAFGVYTYLDITNARSSLDDSFALGNQILFLMSGLYILNILDAAFFYDYSKPISFSQEPKWKIQTARKSINKFQFETYCEIIYQKDL